MKKEDLIKEVNTHQKYIKDNIRGLGRLVISARNNGNMYYLPKLHFLMYKDTYKIEKDKIQNGFSAFCIELDLMTFAEKEHLAIESLSNVCKIHIESLLKANTKANSELDIENLLKQLNFEGHVGLNDGYWFIYRQVNFRNAFKQAKTAEQDDAIFELLRKNVLHTKKLYDELHSINKDSPLLENNVSITPEQFTSAA